jgi:branched-chain amino acid transport system substrate-binding protein
VTHAERRRAPLRKARDQNCQHGQSFIKLADAGKHNREEQMLHMPSRSIACIAAAIVATAIGCGRATAANPIQIGFGMSLTGPLAANGKSALLAMKIWEEDVNAKGGLLGRPVKLVYYDDQSNPSTVPGIYTKLLDIDKVDLIMGGYATNMLAPTMPIAIKRKKLLIGLFGTAVNSEFNYPRYFAMIPLGPDAKVALTKGFFDVAMAQNPKPKTVALVGANAEASHNNSQGVRENAKAAGLQIIYDETYPPATTDFAPIVRAIRATNPDLFVICSYPLDSVGMVRAVNEIGFKPKMIGACMVGPQTTALKAQLGPLLNGFVNYDFWLPVKAMQTADMSNFLKRYQARAQAEGVDPLGYYTPPFAYAYMQVLGQAVEATKSLDDGKLADYIRKTTFTTVIGDIKFGKGGEWAQSRVLQVQYHNIKGNSVDQFKDMSVQTIVAPARYKSGNVIYPYADAKK